MHLHPWGQSRPEANTSLLREISPGLWAADAPPPTRPVAIWGKYEFTERNLSRVVSSWCTSTHEASRDLRQIRVYWEKSLQGCEQLMHLHPRGQSRPEANTGLLSEICPELWAADAPPPMRPVATWGKYEFTEGQLKKGESNRPVVNVGIILCSEARSGSALICHSDPIILIQKRWNKQKNKLGQHQMRGKEAAQYFTWLPDSANRLLCVQIGNGFVHLGAGAQKVQSLKWYKNTW